MIPQFSPEAVSGIHQLLETPRKVVITTHYKPDGDAMGSSLALWHYLVSKGHSATVIAPSDWPDFLSWMPGCDQVINFEHHYSKAKQLTTEAEVIFCLDFNAVSRMEKFGETVQKSGAVKILIDHHLDPESFCQYTFSYPESCATCELVYYFLLALNPDATLSKAVAECLYTGIMTDTGSFRFSSMTADTHHLVGNLMKSGASNFNIHEAIYDNFSLDRTRFLGHCIKEKLVVLPEYKTAYIAVSKEELKEFNHKSGDTEGIVKCSWN